MGLKEGHSFLTYQLIFGFVIIDKDDMYADFVCAVTEGVSEKGVEKMKSVGLIVVLLDYVKPPPVSWLIRTGYDVYYEI